MKKTTPRGYRVSEKVHEEMQRLAKVHGGMDKALRVLMGWVDSGEEVPPNAPAKVKQESIKEEVEMEAFQDTGDGEEPLREHKIEYD